jgi:hypothetical protein
MGLIDRARDSALDDLLQAGEEAAARDRQGAELEARRVEIITGHLAATAKMLGEPLETITQTAIGMPRYYALGDIVVMVQQFMNVDSRPDPGKPHAMLFSYCVYVVTLDDRKHPRHRKVGTLGLLSYEGIVKTINDAPPGTIFEAAAVRSFI